MSKWPESSGQDKHFDDCIDFNSAICFFGTLLDFCTDNSK